MRTWTTKILIIILLILTSLSAYNYFEKPFLKENIEEVIETVKENQEEKKEEQVLKNLSTKEKLSQLLAVPLDLNDFEEKALLVEKENKYLEWLDKNNAGFIVYFGDQVSSSAANLALEKIHENLEEEQYAPLIAVDHEGGLVQRLSGEGFSKLDSWKSLSNDSPSEQRTVFKQSAMELSSVGVDIVFAPVLDLAENNPILKTRAASDPELLYQTTENFIFSFSNEQIMPVVKHFPGIGSIKKDLHFGDDSIVLSAEDTAIFQRVLDKFPNLGVMTAHVRLKDKLGGKICTLSRDCLRSIIEYYPNALLFTDDITMDSAKILLGTSEEREITEIAVEAIKAGNDVLVFGRGVDTLVLDQVLYALEKEYNDSESFRKNVDESLSKILKLKK